MAIRHWVIRALAVLALVCSVPGHAQTLNGAASVIDGDTIESGGAKLVHCSGGIVLSRAA